MQTVKVNNLIDNIMSRDIKIQKNRLELITDLKMSPSTKETMK